MSIAGEMRGLLTILDEKAEAIYQRVEATADGNQGKARYIEQFVYPAINGRVGIQVERVNQAFMEYERRNNEQAKAN